MQRSRTKLTERVACACRLGKVAALEESVEPLQRPVENPRRLVEEFRGQRRVFAPVEAFAQNEEHESTCEGAGGVGKARKFVRQDQEAGWESAARRAARAA